MNNPLPTPPQFLLEHSDRVTSQIVEEILANGPMTFARYMQVALYAPGLGYYSADIPKFGEAGDFITAPEISPLFSHCVARQCLQILKDFSHGDILEVGAGEGLMALEILQMLKREQALPDHYYILELSSSLRERQERLFQKKAPDLISRVHWLNALPASLNGIIIANEVLDAMPVHKFRIENGIKEGYVDYHHNTLIECWGEPSCLQVQEGVQKLGDLSNDYESEINIMLPAWIRSLSDTLNRGVMLFIDYGFVQREYYHPQRNRGTIMCHYRHHAHTDPLRFPGIQDITAHVDFTAVANGALSQKLEIGGFIHQAGFLLNCGIINMFPTDSEVTVHYGLAQQIKRLTLPNEMGELFKVIALTRSYSRPLLGFSAMNRTERLGCHV